MIFDLASFDEISLELAQRLKAKRLAAELKQSELAHKAGVSLGTVRNLEAKGTITLVSLLRIVKALGLIEELSGLFLTVPTSLAALEQAQARRVRIRRSQP